MRYGISNEIERFQRGTTLTEYVVVMTGLAVLFVTIDEIVALIREHNEEYSIMLSWPF